MYSCSARRTPHNNNFLHLQQHTELIITLRARHRCQKGCWDTKLNQTNQPRQHPAPACSHEGSWGFTHNRLFSPNRVLAPTNNSRARCQPLEPQTPARNKG